MRFEFIKTQRDDLSVQQMCELLNVSTSGYYAWLKRPVRQREQENKQLVVEIQHLHKRSRQTYGSPRIHADLQDMEIGVSRKRVARLMRRHGIRTRQKRRFKTTTKADPTRTSQPNLLAQDFSAEAINEKWVADITYIATADGWLYLAAILDVYSRKIVGWSMSPRLHKKLVKDALLMALGRRPVPDGLIHHSDKGSQYTSDDYLKLLKQHHIDISMSGTGNCYDNAMMKSFFATLKAECAFDCFESRRHARQSIFEYIEVWYNRLRRHSALGYLSPEQFEQRSA